MSKTYKVDVWFPAAREVPAGEIKRELVCSDDEKKPSLRKVIIGFSFKLTQ